MSEDDYTTPRQELVPQIIDGEGRGISPPQILPEVTGYLYPVRDFEIWLYEEYCSRNPGNPPRRLY